MLRYYFYWCLHGARRGVRERENFRFTRTRLFGMVRSLANELGERFVKHDLLSDAQDIFYLYLEEIKYFARTGHSEINFRDLANKRINTYVKEYQHLQLPDRITTYGPVGLVNFDLKHTDSPLPNGTLTGLGCASGVVRAPALVVSDPNKTSDTEGKILIAKMTDPGWIFLMLGAKGLVVENGNILSHTAIIGRELGIPTIVGVKDAMSHIHNGNEIEIDGAHGTVRLLSL
jgi:pyruvate,water dikinase